MIIGNPIMLGGGTGKAFAVISVIYPEGSTCTCSDGTKTLKLKDTSGQGFFLIPYAETWTVTATDGTNTKSESFEITSEGQSVSVAISYTLKLFVAGKGALVPFTTVVQKNGVANIEFTTDKISITRNNTNYSGCFLRSTDIIDLKPYEVLRVEVDITAFTSADDQQKCIGISTNAPSSWTTDTPFSFAASHQITKTGQQTVEIDIRSVESGYFAVGAYIYGNITSITLF